MSQPHPFKEYLTKYLQHHGEMMLDSAQNLEKHPEEHLPSVTSDAGTLDADEALSYLRDYPNAGAVRQDANNILTDPKRLKKLVRKIDLTIVPCMVAVYFLQYLSVEKGISFNAIRADTLWVGTK
jgi:hypothetical protein